MSKLELRLPPPLIAAMVALLMWLIAVLIPVLELPAMTRSWPSYLIFLMGFSLLIPSIFSFKKFNTTINPTRPEQGSQLISSGVYRISRNPIYLGFFLLLIGWGLWLASTLALLVSILFPALMTRFQIIPEEQALETLFGDDYLAYKQRVRRWL